LVLIFRARELWRSERRGSTGSLLISLECYAELVRRRGEGIYYASFPPEKASLLVSR